MQPLTWPGEREMGSMEADTLSPHGTAVFIHATITLHLPVTSYWHLQCVSQLL